MWETDPASWVGREVEGLPWRWEQAGLVGDSALGMLNQATWGHPGRAELVLGSKAKPENR